jgi:hypothetical protein
MPEKQGGRNKQNYKEKEKNIQDKYPNKSRLKDTQTHHYFFHFSPVNCFVLPGLEARSSGRLGT